MTVSMVIHMMTQHRRVVEARRSWRTLSTGDGPQTFRMAFPAKGGPRSFPVEGCSGRLVTRTEMWVHFLNRHVLDTVFILDEGNLPHPQCTQYNIMVPRRALNGRHSAKSQSSRGTERKRRRLAEAELRESSERAFEAYGDPL